MNRRDLLTLGGAAAFLAAAVPRIIPAAAAFDDQPGSLRARADRKGLLFGSAVNGRALGDPRLQKVLISDANILVPENELKWDAVMPAPDTYDFSRAEAIYAFAKANDMKMRGHTLTWYRSEPAWAADRIAGMSAAQTGDFLEDYVAHVVGHWKGRIAQWDVINEPTTAKGVLLEKLWSAKLGEQYMDIALHATAQADPHALRMMNQTLIAQEWWWEDKQRDETLRIVEGLLKRGAPLQGFGYEAHLRTSYAFSEGKWARFLEELKQMGLKFMITELDVDDSGTIGDVDARDRASAALVKSLLDVSLSFDHCLGVLTWAAADRYSWLMQDKDRKRSDGMALRPTPRDADFQKKPVWNAIAQALAAAPAR